MPGAKRKKRHYAEDERLDVVELHVQGFTQREIADKTGMSQSNVSTLLKKARTHRTLQDLPKPGAPRKITGKALEYIVVAALRGTYNSAREMAEYLKTNEGIDVSPECVLDALHREGVDSKRLAWLREPTMLQQKRRVAFARKYRGANFRTWAFSDETGLHRQERGRQKRKFVRCGQRASTLGAEHELTGGGARSTCGRRSAPPASSPGTFTATPSPLRATGKSSKPS